MVAATSRLPCYQRLPEPLHHASHTVLDGMPVPVVARLLGHSDVRTTLRYAHLGEREIVEVTERVGQSMAEIMDIDTEIQYTDQSTLGNRPIIHSLRQSGSLCRVAR